MIISGKLKFTWNATLRIAQCQWGEGYSINIIPIHAQSGACTSCHVSLKFSILIKSFKAILNECEIIILIYFLKQRIHVHLSYLIWHSTCSGSMHKCFTYQDFVWIYQSMLTYYLTLGTWLPEEKENLSRKKKEMAQNQLSVYQRSWLTICTTQAFRQYVTSC